MDATLHSNEQVLTLSGRTAFVVGERINGSINITMVDVHPVTAKVTETHYGDIPVNVMGFCPSLDNIMDDRWLDAGTIITALLYHLFITSDKQFIPVFQRVLESTEYKKNVFDIPNAELFLQYHHEQEGVSVTLNGEYDGDFIVLTMFGTDATTTKGISVVIDEDTGIPLPCNYLDFTLDNLMERFK